MGSQNISSINSRPGGTQSALQVNAAAAIKAAPGTLVRVLVQTAGTAGNLVLNDCATVAAAAVGNQIVSLAFGALTAGEQLYLDWPCQTGITVSAVPTGFVGSVSYF